MLWGSYWEAFCWRISRRTGYRWDRNMCPIPLIEDTPNGPIWVKFPCKTMVSVGCLNFLLGMVVIIDSCDISDMWNLWLTSMAGEEGASHGFNETQASTAVVDAKLLKTLLKVLPQQLSLKIAVGMSRMKLDSVGAGVLWRYGLKMAQTVLHPLKS